MRRVYHDPPAIGRLLANRFFCLWKLEHNFTFADEPELISGNSLHRARVVAKLFHIAAEKGDLAFQFVVFGANPFELLLEAAHPREPLRLKDEHRHRKDRDPQNAQGEEALQFVGVPAQGTFEIGMLSTTSSSFRAKFSDLAVVKGQL